MSLIKCWSKMGDQNSLPGKNSLLPDCLKVWNLTFKFPLNSKLRVNLSQWLGESLLFFLVTPSYAQVLVLSMDLGITFFNQGTVLYIKLFMIGFHAYNVTILTSSPMLTSLHWYPSISLPTPAYLYGKHLFFSFQVLWFTILLLIEFFAQYFINFQHFLLL